MVRPAVGTTPIPQLQILCHEWLLQTMVSARWSVQCFRLEDRQGTRREAGQLQMRCRKLVAKCDHDRRDVDQTIGHKP